MTDERAEHAASFDRAAEVYDRARPSYPDAAIDWLVPDDARTVLDLGAGTGKLTRALADRGLDCIAVDPSPNMLAQLRREVPEARAFEGTAERIPLDDASVDVVVLAQAWHWVDEALAVPEVARVLRPGGTLGLIWNIRDERMPWVAELGLIIHDGGSTSIIDDPPHPGPPFGATEQHVTEWEQHVSREALFDLIRSRSYFITKEERAQQRLLAAVSELLDRTGASDTVVLPYRTFAFRTRLSLPAG